MVNTHRSNAVLQHNLVGGGGLTPCCCGRDTVDGTVHRGTDVVTIVDGGHRLYSWTREPRVSRWFRGYFHVIVLPEVGIFDDPLEELPSNVWFER